MKKIIILVKNHSWETNYFICRVLECLCKKNDRNGRISIWAAKTVQNFRYIRYR